MPTKIVVAIILILLVLGAVGYVRGGEPRAIHATGATITALLADDEGLVWLESPPPAEPQRPPPPGPGLPPTPVLKPGGSLYVLPRGETEATCIHSETDLIDIALAGDAVPAIIRDGASGAVVSIPRGGGEPTPIAEGLRRPRSVIEHEGTCYWTETHAAAVDHVTHLPVVGPTVVLMEGGPGVAPTPVAAFGCAAEEFTGKLLGVHDGRLLWLDRVDDGRSVVGWAAVRSVPVDGGVVETLTTERACLNDALLDGGTLYYTGPSEDAGAPMSYRAVRRMSLADGTTETISDWLPHDVCLARRAGRTPFGVSSGGTWLLPGRPGPPRHPGKYRVGGQLGAESGGRLYEVSGVDGQGAIVRVPLTVMQRVTASLSGKAPAPEGPDAP